MYKLVIWLIIIAIENEGGNGAILKQRFCTKLKLSWNYVNFNIKVVIQKALKI